MQEQCVVLITGASSGIGRVTAQLLADSGYRVFGTSRAPRVARDGSVEMLALDVTDDDSVAWCVAQVLERAGRLDVVVNNAGVTLPGAIEEIPVTTARELFETNFFGAARVTKAALPALRRTGGLVVNVSSGFGQAGLPFDAYYSASKHALEGWSEALRQEVASFGVRVVLVQPGFFRSALASGGASLPALAIYQPERRRAETIFAQRVQRGGDPQDVARVIQRLVAHESPPMRMAVGVDSRALIWGKRFAPYGLFLRGFRLIYGLDDWRDAARALWPLAVGVAGLLVLRRHFR